MANQQALAVLAKPEEKSPALVREPVMEEEEEMEDASDYLWRSGMIKMTLEVQCFCVALTLLTQVWILLYFGSDVFQKLVGNELALPLLYLLAVISGTFTYMNPTYWRITMSLTIYCVSVYFSTMVTSSAIQMMVNPDYANLLIQQPSESSITNLRVWIPWSVGFVLHFHMLVSGFGIALISVRDMYYYNPVPVTDPQPGDLVIYDDSDPIYMIVENYPDPEEEYLSVMASDDEEFDSEEDDDVIDVYPPVPYNNLSGMNYI